MLPTHGMHMAIIYIFSFLKYLIENGERLEIRKGKGKGERGLKNEMSGQRRETRNLASKRAGFFHVPEFCQSVLCSLCNAIIYTLSVLSSLCYSIAAFRIGHLPHSSVYLLFSSHFHCYSERLDIKR